MAPTDRKPASRIDDVPVPEPMELAKLAAILAPNASPNAALKKATRFYVEAVLYTRELPVSVEELVRQFGSPERCLNALVRPVQMAHDALLKEMFADTLELNPQKPRDEVREFLSQQGLTLKTSRAVLDNIRRCIESRKSGTFSPGARLSVDGEMRRFECWKDVKKIYKIPKRILELVASQAKQRRSEVKHKAWKTRKG